VTTVEKCQSNKSAQGVFGFYMEQSATRYMQHTVTVPSRTQNISI